MREAFVVVDLGFGDAGKGATVDFLTRDRDAELVVRFHGGGQAGHRVVLDDGRAHVFSQVGAGTFVPGVRTHLTEDFVLHPLGLRAELERLGTIGVDDACSRLSIDRRALLITPFHQAAGRLVELARGAERHGSVGIGLGDAVADAVGGAADVLRAADLRSPDLERTLRRVWTRKRDLVDRLRASLAAQPLAEAELELLQDDAAPRRIARAWTEVGATLDLVHGAHLGALLADTPSVVFEGAQGVLLDERWGFHPHTTYSDCTFALAERALLDARWAGAVHRLGVVRAYATRHGRGPFPSETAAYSARLRDAENQDGGFQGEFRTGPLDLVLLRYALQAVGGIDGLVVTCLDRLAALPESELVTAYELAEPSALVRRDAWGNVRALEPGRAEDLGHRQRLGELLGRVRPVRTPVAPADLVARVEAELGTEAVLLATGPTAADRRWVASRFRGAP